MVDIIFSCIAQADVDTFGIYCAGVVLLQFCRLVVHLCTSILCHTTAEEITGGCQPAWKCIVLVVS